MAAKQTNLVGAVDLFVALHPPSGRGVRAALEDELRRAVRDGRLVAGVTLPPSRTLARELGVSRAVVVEAYAQLAAEGYLDARRGSRTFVRGAPAAQAPPPRPPEPPALAHFATGVPDPALFPRRDWQRHHRAALRELSHRQLGQPRAQGATELRAALTRYLGACAASPPTRTGSSSSPASPRACSSSAAR